MKYIAAPNYATASLLAQYVAIVPLLTFNLLTGPHITLIYQFKRYQSFIVICHSHVGILTVLRDSHGSQQWYMRLRTAQTRIYIYAKLMLVSYRP